MIHALYKSFQRPAFRGLFSATLNHLEATRCVSDALVLIRDHWRLVWHRPPADLSAAISRIDEELSRPDIQPAAQTQWLRLITEQLANCAARLKGKQGHAGAQTIGPETNSRTLATVCRFLQTLRSRRYVTIAMDRTYAAQCHLPKAQKGVSPQWQRA